jgi:hypothetical protein
MPLRQTSLFENNIKNHFVESKNLIKSKKLPMADYLWIKG